MPAATNPPRPGRPGKRAWLFAGLAMLACGLAITARSFWIDECYTALLARQATLNGCWHLLREVKGSDPQMPLYVLWIWSCEKFSGDSELALRAVNLLWFVPALVALAAAFAGDRRRQAAVFLAAVLSPFAWYYLNEARSYTMQFSLSLILFATIGHWSRDEKKAAGTELGWALGFALALFCLCGSSLLAMVLAAVPLLLAPVALTRKRLVELRQNFLPLWLATFGALFMIGLYYLWTLHAGDRGTDVATTGWKNIVFIGYELSGFAGLGPGRLEIRSGDGHVFAAYAASLITYAVLAATLAGLALADLRGRFGAKKVFAMALAVGLPAGLVLAASMVSHFRILGRHCSALLPVMILLLGLGAAAAWRRGTAGRLLVVTFFGFYLASALSLRLATRHEKDDYRAAAETARAALAAGKSAWWNADPNAAAYYRVPLIKSGPVQDGHARWVLNPTAESLATVPRPDVIIASRRDVYDGTGALADFLAREHYHAATNFMAFTIWTHGEN